MQTDDHELPMLLPESLQTDNHESSDLLSPLPDDIDDNPDDSPLSPLSQLSIQNCDAGNHLVRNNHRHM